MEIEFTILYVKAGQDHWWPGSTPADLGLGMRTLLHGHAKRQLDGWIWALMGGSGRRGQVTSKSIAGEDSS